MYVRITEPTFIKGKSASPGDVADVSDVCALHLLGNERAVQITEEEFAKGPAKKAPASAK